MPSFRSSWTLGLSTLALALSACGDDGTSAEVGDSANTFTDSGLSSGSGESSDEGSSSGTGSGTSGSSDSGDSSSSGDGDGDSGSSGDGDGDGDSGSTGDGDGDGDTGGGTCTPGTMSCYDTMSTQTCNPGGTGWEPPVNCAAGTSCQGGVCLTPCQVAELEPSSVGCSFHANKMQNFIEEPTSLVDTLTATVQLYQGSGGSEVSVGAAVTLAPLQAHTFTLSSPSQPGDVSVLRTGGAYRVESNVPLVAYQHSPIAAEAHNDSSMLLPDHAQGRFFIVASYPGNVGSDHSYFNVVGIEDNTSVTWQPPYPTSAGTGVPAVAAGANGNVTLNANDMLQVISTTDTSGTLVQTDKRAWVVGAVPCVNIPAGTTFCDHIEEQMIPLEYWGDEYVGAHAPTRGNEDYHWRVYAGQDGVTITTTPPQPGTPVTLNRGQFHQFISSGSFVFTGTGPFMPVQYLEGQNGGAGTGDPASYQMVPTEQYLDRYVFVTGTDYSFHYAQIVRPVGAAEVYVDGTMVTGYQTVGSFQVADWPINEGAHVAESTAPFGIYQVGYTNVTSYAYPGGLRLRVINPQ